MSKTKSNIEKQMLCKFTEKSYLNYSMYVIMDRALPSIGDGLKPVQRRIIYAMSELGLNHNAKHKKSARTIGDVLGKYHPHSDVACYEAMVLMAQPFSYRYPMIDGQGNWGSPDDPKSFAAMRYTESKLSKYAESLLSKLELKTMNWIPNFDNTIFEPKILPARLPNILLNGSTGIAVGMATDIPPHNIKEISSAVIALLDNPSLGINRLMNFVNGPDYPTESEIVSSKEDIKKIYQTGKGSIRIRSTWKIEDGNVIISSLPYQVSGMKVFKQIDSQIRNKKLSMIEDFRDESDHENKTRFVIIPKNKIDLQKLMIHLFLTTDLEKSYRINLNMIGLNNKPEIKGLVSILKEWILFRKIIVRNRLKYRLKQLTDRLHIVIGLIKVYVNVKDLINIFHEEKNPKFALIKNFSISEIQATYVLETKIKNLTKPELEKLIVEKKNILNEIDKIKKILKSEFYLKELIKKEIQEDTKTYGDSRRTFVRNETIEKKIIRKEKDKVIPITIVLSKMRWIKVVKGHEVNPIDLEYKIGDSLFTYLRGKSDQLIVLLSSNGKSFSINPSDIFYCKRKWEPITGRLKIPYENTINHILTSKNDKKYFLSSNNGYGFKCNFQDLISKNKSGKTMIKLKKNFILNRPIRVKDEEKELLLLITNFGNMLIIPVVKVPNFKRGIRKRIIDLYSDKIHRKYELLSWIFLMFPKSSVKLTFCNEDIILSPKDLKRYFSGIGSKGFRLPNFNNKIINIKIIN
ncbi:DNA topoisomerase IV [Candidatus Riesia sp. GBBU]|nr:DNA topoisomerase IV [Candidatus Riesia sp. GBBU]